MAMFAPLMEEETLRFQVFTDGSVNTKLKVGYGAFLAHVVSPCSEKNVSIDSLKHAVKVQRFEETNSTKLELQTLLWAVNETTALANEREFSLTVYTDSQNIIGLPDRRARLESTNYYSSKNIQLRNHELYREFYRLFSSVKFELIKVEGHRPTSKKGEIDSLFSLVDRATRRALREEFS